jgi:hypothetical protein
MCIAACSGCKLRDHREIGSEWVMDNGTGTAIRASISSSRDVLHRCGIVLALLGAATGCSKQNIIGGGTTQVAGAVPTDTFLPQPGLLGPGASGQADLVYFAPGLNFSNYSAILLDPVAIISDSASPLATASPQQREALANTYYSDLYSALSKHCKMTNSPAPSTLRFTFALTDAKLSNGVVKTLATYTPYVMVAYKVGSVAFNNGAGYFSGTATSEAYATDAMTGNLLWQAVDKRAGSVALVQNTTNSWNDVDNAMKGWSDQAVNRLQALGVCRL